MIAQTQPSPIRSEGVSISFLYPLQIQVREHSILQDLRHTVAICGQSIATTAFTAQQSALLVVFWPLKSYKGESIANNTFQVSNYRNPEFLAELDIKALRNAATKKDYDQGQFQFATCPASYKREMCVEFSNLPFQIPVPNEHEVAIWESIFFLAVQRIAFGERWKSEYGKLTLLSVLSGRDEIGYSELETKPDGVQRKLQRVTKGFDEVGFHSQ